MYVEEEEEDFEEMAKLEMEKDEAQEAEQVP